MKSSVLGILAAVVLGAGLMFCAGKLMNTREGSPVGSRPEEGGTGDEGGSAGSREEVKPPVIPSMRLVRGKRYRMMVVSARLPARKRNGDPWDMSAGLPDCFFVLRTPENRYKSSMVKDCLVPNWADKSLSVRELWNGNIRVSNEGAVFLYDPTSSSRIYLDFVDSDVMKNDPIVNLVFQMSDLKAGYTEYKVAYSTNSLSINSGTSRETPDMVFTVRVVPDGM
ncbi:MAG: C2 domain-containing protein [Phycisphaerae bacterium]|nr:C2 domain-containing protein [Phycisphaerae bacterium]